MRKFLADLPFQVERWAGQNDDAENVEVMLAPHIADYAATLSYDGRGNANVTITRKVNPTAGVLEDEVVLDMSLDNGEINEIDWEVFHG